LLSAIRTLIRALTKRTLRGKLWIIEAGRIRVYEENGER